MTDPKMLDALNNCIDMLANGQSLDACLTRYPQYADQLRTLLQAGQVTGKARVPASEVLQAKARVDATVLAAIEQIPIAGASSVTPTFMTPLTAAAVVVLVIGIGIITLVTNGRNHFAVTPFPEETLTMMPVMTNTPTETATATATLTSTPTETATATATLTSTPTLTPTDVKTVMVIEGPITAITDDSIFIYTFEIPLSGNISDDLEIGDFVRVEIADDTVNLVQEPQPDDSTVGSGNGNTGGNSGNNSANNPNNPNNTSGEPIEVWRDDGTCQNPPPEWAPAGGWRERCEGANHQPPGQQNNNSGQNNSGQNPPGNNQGNPNNNSNQDNGQGRGRN